MTDAIDAWIASYPDAGSIPFNLSHHGVYTVAELYAGLTPGKAGTWPQTFDQRIYSWFVDQKSGNPRKLSIGEAVAARVHDAAVENGINAFIQGEGVKVVGFMGGHEVRRADASFEAVARMARSLRRVPYQVVSGGGPGLMEAANLGAFLAPYHDDALGDALAMLRTSELSDGAEKWIESACAVRAHFLGAWDAPADPAGSNLGIPTWLYGNEPPNLFASAIGKYFYNSVREDGLVNVASGGLVFGRGAAGTVQEIFQDMTLNFYAGSKHAPTPMVYLGSAFWDPDMKQPGKGALPVMPLVRRMADLSLKSTPPLRDLLLLSDDPDAIVDFLMKKDAAASKATIAELRLEGA